MPGATCPTVLCSSTLCFKHPAFDEKQYPSTSAWMMLAGCTTSAKHFPTQTSTRADHIVLVPAHAPQLVKVLFLHPPWCHDFLEPAAVAAVETCFHSVNACPISPSHLDKQLHLCALRTCIWMFVKHTVVVLIQHMIDFIVQNPRETKIKENNGQI